MDLGKVKNPSKKPEYIFLSVGFFLDSIKTPSREEWTVWTAPQEEMSLVWKVLIRRTVPS